MKCNTLMEFILAQGFSTQQLNDFANRGEPSTHTVNDQDLFVQSPMKENNVKAPPAVSLSAGLTMACPLSKEPSGAGSKVLEEGEIPRFVAACAGSSLVGDLVGSPVGLAKPSRSSVVAMKDPQSSLKLDYLPPSPPSSDNGAILERPPSAVLLKGISLWNTSLVLRFPTCSIIF